MSTSTTLNTASAAPHTVAASLASSAANSLPDELLDHIFSCLVSPDVKQHPLYSVCLASRRFRRVAQPLLWEVVALEVDDDEGGDAFVEGAQQYGQHTRDVSLVFSQTADTYTYHTWVAALKHLRGAQSLQVVFHNAYHKLFPSLAVHNIGSTTLEHFGVVGLACQTSMPPISSLRNVTSLDLLGSGLGGFLWRLYETPNLMPSLRALAADLWSIPHDCPDHLLAQLDMVQSNVENSWLIGAPQDEAPFLGSYVLYDFDEVGPTQFSADARHVSISGMILVGAFVRTSDMAASIDNLAFAVEAGTIESLWLPHDPTRIGSPSGDADVDAAWDRLCTAARDKGIPGRLVGDEVDPRMLSGGRLDFDFWQYAKALRAAGEV